MLYKKQSFSIVEVLIAFALMVLVVVVAGVRPLALFRDTAARECKRMTHRLVQQAAQYSVLTQAGMTLSFALDKERLTISMKGENTPNSELKQLLGLGETLDKAPPMTLVLHDDRRIDAPFAVTFYPDGVCCEEKTAAPLKCIEIARASNGQTSRIELNLPPSPYAAKAPASLVLYPKIKTS